MSGCRHEWHDYHRLSFPCPDCGTWADEGNSSATDYHELPKVPKCCATCKRLDIDLIDGEPASGHHECGRWNKHVVPHGICSQWEKRRNDGR